MTAANASPPERGAATPPLGPAPAPAPTPGPAAVATAGIGVGVDVDAVPLRHPGRWAAGVVILVFAAMGVHSLATNPNFQWGTVGDYLFAEPVLRGMWATVYLTVIAMAIGVVGGIGLAILRMSPNPVVAGAAWLYIWFFRGTPLLVQILFWSFIGALYPRLSLGIPFGPSFVSGDANHVVPLFAAAVLGLGLNEAAYMAEIVRAGINGVDAGQTEAASALGMPRALTLRRIVLPQAMRTIIPPTGNETISMLKTTSLVSVISYNELLNATRLIYARNFQTVPLLIVAALWYLALTSVLTAGQHQLERRFARGILPRVGERR
ncbi:amino acid ABC transporter permease [Frankia gtarii]|uniref:amino acid ABC transporter permease n=1 Tax=Frankia gtarii TaxID=2950102 RepID=UPI003F686EFC